MDRNRAEIAIDRSDESAVPDRAGVRRDPRGDPPPGTKASGRDGGRVGPGVELAPRRKANHASRTSAGFGRATMIRELLQNRTIGTKLGGAVYALLAALVMLVGL